MRYPADTTIDIDALTFLGVNTFVFGAAEHKTMLERNIRISKNDLFNFLFFIVSNFRNR